MLIGHAQCHWQPMTVRCEMINSWWLCMHQCWNGENCTQDATKWGYLLWHVAHHFPHEQLGGSCVQCLCVWWQELTGLTVCCWRFIIAIFAVWPVVAFTPCVFIEIANDVHCFVYCCLLTRWLVIGSERVKRIGTWLSFFPMTFTRLKQLHSLLWRGLSTL